MNRFILFLLVIIASCNIKTPQRIQNKEIIQNEEGFTEFVFDEEIHNFGNLIAGEIVICNFTFENTGDKNLFIEKIDKGCGCLEVKSDKDFYPPGSDGNIEVTFDTSGLHGKQFKMFAIYANIEESKKELAVTANVINNEIIEY